MLKFLIILFYFFPNQVCDKFKDNENLRSFVFLGIVYSRLASFIVLSEYQISKYFPNDLHEFIFFILWHNFSLAYKYSMKE